MNYIKETFPLQREIEPKTVDINVYFKGQFQYAIHTEVEINNIRLWAIVNNMTEHVEFHWNGIVISLTAKGDLSNWSNGMFDQFTKQFAKMIRFRRGEDIELTFVN